MDEYCEQNGISRNAYYYWLRRVKNAALVHAKTTFVELNIPTDKTIPQASAMVHSFIPQLTIEKNGFVISLTPMFNDAESFNRIFLSCGRRADRIKALVYEGRQICPCL